MNIKQLRIFVEVCEQGSFTRAANKLFMTQQAVSHSIVTLENSLNCTLFDRNAGALLLTESGIFLRDNCQTLLREDDLLQYKMENYIAKGEVIRVGYGFGMLRNLPLNFFVNFQKKFPRYSIHGTEMLNLTCEMGVDSKELDVAFTIGPVDESRFTSITLYRDNLVAIMEKDHPLAQKSMLNIADLKGTGLICNSGKNRNSLITCCNAVGFTPNIIHCCTDLISQCYLCQHSPYVVITVDQMLDQMFLQYPSLRKVSFDDSIYHWEMCLITKKGQKLSKATSAFISYVIENHLGE